MRAAACRGCRSSSRSAPPRRRSRSRCRTSIAIGSRDARRSAAATPTWSPSSRATGGASLFKGRAWIDAATFGMLRVVGGADRAQGADHRVGADRRLRAGRRPALAARAVRRAPDLRRRERAHADPSAAGHRAARVNAADFAAQRTAALCLDRRDAPRHARTAIAIWHESRKPEAGSRKPEAGSRKPEAGSRQRASSPGAPSRIRTVRVRRHRRSEHLAAAAVRRPELRRLQPVRDRHAVQRVLRRQLRAARVLGAVDRAARAGSSPGARSAIASSYNDRAFESGREQYPLDIRQRPAQAAVWVLRPLSARTALRLEYDWDYNRYERGTR